MLKINDIFSDYSIGYIENNHKSIKVMQHEYNVSFTEAAVQHYNTSADYFGEPQLGGDRLPVFCEEANSFE